MRENKDIKKERMKSIIFINEDSISEIIKKFNVSRSTAYRAVKRGYLCLNYHTKEVVVGDINAPFFTTGEVYRLAWAVLNRYFIYSIESDTASDMVSEAVLRLVELSGHPLFQKKEWRWVVAHRACLGFLKTNKSIATPSSNTNQCAVDALSYMDMVETSNNKKFWLDLYFKLSQKEIKELEAILVSRKPKLSLRLRKKILTLMAQYSQEQEEEKCLS